MGEKKEPVKMSLGTLFLILIIFILLTIILVMYLENKNIISINLKQNANETISENKVANEEKFNEEENEFEKIILEGDFGIENSGVIYHFYKDGTVELGSEMEESKGIYYAVGENQIEMKFTRKIIWDDEGNTTEEPENVISKGTIKGKHTISIEFDSNGEKNIYDIFRCSSDPVEQNKFVRERLEEKYSNVVYRRETEGSSGYYIENGVVYTESGKLTQGVVGKAKYVLPLDKQIGTGIVLTEEGKIFKSEGMGEELEKFKEVELGYRIIEIINLPDVEGHLFLAYDGTILNIDGTIFGKV